MTKYFNKEKIVTGIIQEIGNSETPDTTAVTVIKKDSSGYVTEAKGTTVPTDTETGFAKGCHFVDTNVAAGVPNLYINVGDHTSCDFNVAGSDLPAGSIDATELATDSVDSDEIATDAVGAAEIASNAVGTDEIQDASIAPADLGAQVAAEQICAGIPGTVAEFTFPFNVITDTEQAAALAVTDDGGDLQQLATSSAGAGVTANYQLFPDVPAENDAAYFGAAAPFGILYFDMSAGQPATYGADSLIWEYWNGAAWSTLTIVYDHTDSTAQDGLRSFQRDGYILFSAPTDWANTTVNGQAGFWVRARVNTGFNITQIPLTNSVEHKIASDANAPIVPFGMLVSAIRFTFKTASAANNDTKIIVCNLTSGACTSVLTLTKAVKSQLKSSLTLPFVSGEFLAIFITQEDGTTEFADGMLEIYGQRQ